MVRKRSILTLTAVALMAAAPSACAKSYVEAVPPYGDFRVGAPVLLSAAVASEATGPLSHVQPVVLARRLGAHEVLRFRAAAPTDSGGGTKLRVRFPHAGTWRLRVTVPGRRIMN